MEDLSKMKHFIGCDVSKETLDFGVFISKTDYRKFPHLKVSNTPIGYREAISWLKSQGIKKTEMVIAMEHTGFYSNSFSDWLYGQEIVYTMLNPRAVKKSSCGGRNKTDKEDAQYIADYVYTNREKLKQSFPESSEIKELRGLLNERKLCIKSQVMYKNLIKVQTDKKIRNRIFDMIVTISDQIEEIEKDMYSRIDSNAAIKKNYNLLVSICGVGLINAVATIVATGNFTRFQTARQYAKFCKVAPLEHESGKSVRGGTHVPVMGHGELKSLLTLAARSAIVHNTQLKSFYEKKRLEGKPHGCVMNAVKFKLICRMFSVIKRGTPYVNIEKYKN